MIELKSDMLQFSFPDVHPDAKMSIDFQRTLRIPDDGGEYPLPAGLGRFPLRHVDDFGGRAPALWLERGGIMLPMYQSEAMWLNFRPVAADGRRSSYPFAVKVAAGKVNAVSGEEWTAGVHRDPQDYMVIPAQPWLDGFCVERGLIRQFVAMPLGAGYSAEEQLTGAARHGGLQIAVFPMKREVFETRFPKTDRVGRHAFSPAAMPAPLACPLPDMGLAPGGRMRQEIREDRFEMGDWDLRNGSRCFVHLANSLLWRMITGENPPTTPPTTREYAEAGLPWFDLYAADREALLGSKVLAGLKSVADLGGLGKEQVREGRF